MSGATSRRLTFNADFDAYIFEFDKAALGHSNSESVEVEVHGEHGCKEQTEGPHIYSIGI